VIIALFGGNELAMRRRMQALKDEADGGTGMLLTNLTELDGRDAKAHDILSAVMSPPFLSPKRLVVVEHFLERFEARGGPRQARSADPFEPLFSALDAGIPESTILVFLGQPFMVGPQKRFVSSTNSVVKRIAQAPGASIEEMPAPSKEGLTRYIREEAQARGIRFRGGRAAAAAYEAHEEVPDETDPIQLLANLVQGDTLTIANELDKLALYSMGREVTVAEVNRVCAGDRESNRFALLDALMDGKLGPALEMLKRLIAEGENIQGLLGSITDSYRRAATIIDLMEQGANDDEIGRAMGNAGKYQGLRNAAKARARRLGPHGLRQAYAALVEADRTNKLGEVQEDVAIEILAARLTAIGGGAR